MILSITVYTIHTALGRYFFEFLSVLLNGLFNEGWLNYGLASSQKIIDMSLSIV